MSDYKRKPGHVKDEHNGKPRRVTPYEDAARILKNGWQATELKDTMTLITEDVLNSLFIEWLSTDSHEEKKREFIYSKVLALGANQQAIESAIMLAKNYKQSEGDQ